MKHLKMRRNIKEFLKAIAIPRNLPTFIYWLPKMGLTEARL